MKPNNRSIYQSPLAITIAAGISCVLVACGGGDGGSLPAGNSCCRSLTGGGTPPATYTIGGNVTGLARDAQVTLDNNSSNPLTVTANGTFTFTTPVAYNGSYAVTLGTQPAGQTCTVSGGSGAGVTANVSNVSVACRQHHCRSNNQGDRKDSCNNGQ